MKKPPPIGLLLVVVALGAGAVGFFLGRAGDAPPDRSRAGSERPVVLLADPERGLPTVAVTQDWLAGENGGGPGAAAADAPLGPPPSELVQALRTHAGSERAQQIVAGMIADAALRGGEALPELRTLLESGEDIRFTGFDGRPGGFPSLRVALLAAAEATGDPAAAQLIAEVAATTESPVEVVWSAHLLDRLDALDAKTAQRTLDSLNRKLTPEEFKAMGPVVRQVVPAVAAADPGYAETFLLANLRAPPGQGAHPRLVAPALDGLPIDRARDLVFSTLTTGDVHDRTKRMLAGQAAQRPELGMLQELRRAIETNTMPAPVAGAVAHNAVGGRAFHQMQRDARQALRAGDLDGARELATQFHARIDEAHKTVGAARTAGAQVSRKADTTLQLHRQTLDQLRAEIAREIKRRERAAAEAERRG